MSVKLRHIPMFAGNTILGDGAVVLIVDPNGVARQVAQGVQAAAGQAEAEAAEGRASQVRTMDRSERIRTYNWPENRISDHRINYKSNNLDSVLDGNMDDLITALQTHERQERLEAE